MPVRPADQRQPLVKVTIIDRSTRRGTLETPCALGNTVVLKGAALVLASRHKFD